MIATPTKTACRSLNISPSVISRTIRSTSYCLGTIQVKTTTEEMKPTTQPLSPNWGAAGTSVINKRNPAGTIGRTRRKAIPNSATMRITSAGWPKDRVIATIRSAIHRSTPPDRSTAPAPNRTPKSTSVAQSIPVRKV